jgi:hypothetical protein
MAAENANESKMLIPEEWANRSRCPVCGSVYLSLKRSYEAPDQLACDTCKARFEISQDGCRVRVMVPPPGVPFDQVGQWIDPTVAPLHGKAQFAKPKQSYAVAYPSHHEKPISPREAEGVTALPSLQGHRSPWYWVLLSLVSFLVIVTAVVIGLGLGG